MVFMLPIIIDSGKTILQVLEDYRDIDHNNYKQYLKYEATNIITEKLNNKLLDKFKNTDIQYNILNKLFNFDEKLEILNDIYKSKLFIKHFGTQRFISYPLIFPNIVIDFVGYYIWDFVFKFFRTPSRINLQTNNIKDKDKDKLTLLFQKLIIGPSYHEDIVDIDDDDDCCNIEFPCFENNIYITIKDVNHNDYDGLVELIQNKIILTNDYEGLYVLIIDHPIDNRLELDDLCNESSNKIITIYL